MFLNTEKLVESIIGSHFLILIIGFSLFSPKGDNIYSSEFEKKLASEINEPPVMCFDIKGKCVGSVYCTACTTCNYCAHCNSGGSCGVCGKRARTYYPNQRNKTYKKSQNNSEISIQKNSHSSTYITNEYYVVIQKTSLRILPDSQSKVLERLDVNGLVQMIECFSEKYWCKVSLNDEVGWVKKHLLKRKNTTQKP